MFVFKLRFITACLKLKHNTIFSARSTASGCLQYRFTKKCVYNKRYLTSFLIFDIIFLPERFPSLWYRWNLPRVIESMLVHFVWGTLYKAFYLSAIAPKVTHPISTPTKKRDWDRLIRYFRSQTRSNCLRV